MRKIKQREQEKAEREREREKIRNKEREGEGKRPSCDRLSSLNRLVPKAKAFIILIRHLFSFFPFISLVSF